MNDAHSPNGKLSLFENRLLRREAGDEWHKKGINEQLLGALVTREELLDDIVDKQKDVGDETRQALWDKYMSQVEEVIRIKTQNGISDPPPMHILSMEQE